MARPVKVVVLGDSGDAQKAFQQIRAEADKTQGHFDGIGSKLTSSLGPAALAAPILAGAAIVGGLFVKGFLDGMEDERLNDKLAAQLGLSEEQAETASRVATDVYREAWGESLGEVNDAIKGIENSLGGLSNFSETETRGMVEDALTIADVWDQDVNEVIRAAGALFDSGLAQSADEAFDIISTGLQEGVDINGDFLDTLFEYSTFFDEAGISAERMLAGLVEGTGAGMMGVDKVGDAVKEMSLKVQENTEPIQQALEDVGLDADAVADAFAKGGDFAGEATAQILEGLANMEDPLDQHNAAVTLLGTPYEDLGAVGAEVLDALVNGTLDLVDTQAIADTAYDNTATAVEEFKRRGAGAVQDFVGSALAAFGVGGEDGSLKSGLDSINDWIDDNQEQIEQWGEDFAAWAIGAWEDMQPVIDALGNIAEWFSDSDNMQAIADWASDIELWANVANAALTPLANVLGLINDLFNEASKKSSKGGGFGSKGGSEGGSDWGSDLPAFHDGGTVPGFAGQEMVALLEAGETVIPAGGGAGNVTIIVEGSVISERDLVDVVHDGLLRKARRSPLGL